MEKRAVEWTMDLMGNKNRGWDKESLIRSQQKESRTGGCARGGRTWKAIIG